MNTLDILHKMYKAVKFHLLKCCLAAAWDNFHKPYASYPKPH